ncbi:GntR family transcriptional regulator [Arthrobacter sp. ZGTC412]|uniref:GntR family transcriptional regulator n=1 Tax=Arthrobacter sp. ZGTC412 TaxID=2058900 RepID=UPI000CE37830|nr:GntR family transcriptional regulator [Arthrobacter sp. ZGTC412]
MSRSSSTDIQPVVAGLREAISKGELVANQRLIEQDICDEYRASRGTVRAALAELATEGLVERIQNRGARVRSVSISEAIEILEVRSLLEAHCAGKAALLAAEEDKLALKAVGEDMVKAIDGGDLYRYSELNNALHQLVLDISKQQTAASVIHRLKTQMVRHQFRLTMRSGGPSASLAEHLAIIEAICEGESDAARQTMWEHLASVTDTLRGLAEAPVS